MNKVSHPALQLFFTILAFAVLAPLPTTASDLNADTRFKMAMGPTSAAQKNQDATARSDDVSRPPHRSTHRYKPHD